jgi:hypothetical protein
MVENSSKHFEPPPDRGEFADADCDHHPSRRNSDEHPEQAYRRGYQQGAHAIAEAMRAAELLDERVLKTIDDYISVLGLWRFGKRALKRELARDRAPRLILRGRR